MAGCRRRRAPSLAALNTAGRAVGCKLLAAPSDAGSLTAMHAHLAALKATANHLLWRERTTRRAVELNLLWHDVALEAAALGCDWRRRKVDPGVWRIDVRPRTSGRAEDWRAVFFACCPIPRRWTDPPSAAFVVPLDRIPRPSPQEGMRVALP